MRFNFLCYQEVTKICNIYNKKIAKQVVTAFQGSEERKHTVVQESLRYIVTLQIHKMASLEACSLIKWMSMRCKKQILTPISAS